jgi:uncharacterized protein (DUF1800 family)
MKRAKRIGRERHALAQQRIDCAGVSLLAVLLATLLVLAIPSARASAQALQASANPLPALDKKFKGRLPITELTEDEAIVHALNRLAYGPRQGEVERIRRMGLEEWVDQQLNPESIDDSHLDDRLSQYATLEMSSKKLLSVYPPPQLAAQREGVTKDEYKEQMEEKRKSALAQILPTGNDNFDKANVQLAKIQGPERIIAELSMAKLDRAIFSNRQLEAVMEDFWFNHFNVFANKAADKWLVTAYVRDTIRPNAMGRFQDLLLATAKSPAMLIYLDNWLSVDPKAVQRVQQEAQARRYQGIFAAGPPPQPRTSPGQVPPNANGKKQDRGLNENYGREVMELHTVGVDAGYTQQDVIAMAETLTGWTVHEPRRDPEFFFDDRFHTQGKKIVMGKTFSAGGIKDGEEALKFLAGHPDTARFISAELARHFVSDDPPPAIVDRMAKSYISSNGEIRAVLKTMIYSPEFWSKQAYRAKVKTPLELVASTARALNADVEVTLPLVQWAGRMGEPLFLCQPPTGYSDKSSTWVNTGSLLNRLNFAIAFAADRMPGAKVNLDPLMGPDSSSDPTIALTRALGIFLDGQVSDETRQILEARMKDPQVLRARLDDPVKQVNQGLIAGLVLGAPEFQRR